MNNLKQQIEQDLYEIYPKIYKPVYKMKKKLNILCGSDYNTRVCTFEKIGENQIILDNSFMGFCRDIFLNPAFDYFSFFKENCFHEITFEDIWKTIQAYNHCRDLKKQMALVIESTMNTSLKYYPIPSFINKNNFIQGINFGNSSCYIFILELKDFFCIIKCTES